ncbi:MAG TPA: fasciclin domain-containing protein, partial [Euzebya sp.]|nr:fasciclin domain-containing protein [Euzebya sp.]
AIHIADLGDTLNRAGSLTILAPTDCAFAQTDPTTLDAVLADPQGQLTTLLGYHVIAGEQIPAADLTGSHTTFTGETIRIDGTDVDGQASIVVPDIQTANATVHLIDTVLVPPSLQNGLTED